MDLKQQFLDAADLSLLGTAEIIEPLCCAFRQGRVAPEVVMRKITPHCRSLKNLRVIVDDGIVHVDILTAALFRKWVEHEAKQDCAASA